jgi:hypothetical protein
MSKSKVLLWGRGMKVRIFTLIMVASSAVLAGCVTQNADGVLQGHSKKVAVSGERTRIKQSWHVEPDCSSGAVPTVRITQAPQNGTTDTVTEQIFPKTRGKYAKCETKKINSAVTYYKSNSGFVGKDKVALRESFHDGRVVDVNIDINVVK